MRGRVIVLCCGVAAAVTALLAWNRVVEPAAPERPVPSEVATADTRASEPGPQLPPPRPPVPDIVAAPVAPAPAAIGAKALPSPAMPPSRSAFALSSDHRALIQGTLLAATDLDRLESEARDDPWAAEAERLIRQALVKHDGAADFDVIAIDCRQTLCAIQAFSNGENGHRRWVEAVDELYRDALGSLFDSVNTAFPTQGSSRSPVLTLLHRKPPAPSQ